MFQTTVTVRVRYAETDRMGYVYHGNFATYFEVARVEALRQLGFSYKQMEDDGIVMPVFDLHIRYYKPALYDDVLTIKTKIASLPITQIGFEYETYNQDSVLLNTATTALAFVSRQTMKPCRPPLKLIRALQNYFSS